MTIRYPAFPIRNRQREGSGVLGIDGDTGTHLRLRYLRSTASHGRYLCFVIAALRL